MLLYAGTGFVLLLSVELKIESFVILLISKSVLEFVVDINFILR